MMIEWKIIEAIISIVALFLGILSFWDKKWGEVAKIREDLLAISGRVPADNLSRLVALETRVGPFWKVLEENLIDFLKRPIHLRMDELLDKYKIAGGNLDLIELSELKCQLLDVISEFRNRKEKKILSENEAGVVVGYVFMLGMVESRICEKTLKGESLSSCMPDKRTESDPKI